MSNVGYDLDTSGGLMPLIRALIKPPDEEGNGQKPKKPQHPYYKRPGKGHNHDSCDACGEGGDLICCDRCPASFHLGCYDPPLDENDIPAGLWLCRECRASDSEPPTSSKGSRAVSPADSKSDNEKKTRSLRKRTNSKKRSKDESEEEGEKEVKKEQETEKDLSPMEVLVKAAKIMNPTQFELPKEMQIPCIFPGTEKEGTKNGTASVITTDSSGCVPLPAKSCYVCLGTCKQAPLIQCDYCPLLFHQDCLDPPLTALPTGRWMCPNHVEKFIDWKLVNSISMTERVALWDRFTGPVDQHAIKIDFIRRARKYRPMFRMKVPARARGRVVVPAMVRRHYGRPAPLLPSRRDYVRCTNVLKKLKESGVYSESEDEDAPKHTICMNLSCPEYRGTGPCEHAPPTPDDAQEADNKTTDDETKIEQPSDCSSDLSDSDFEYVSMSVKRRKLSPQKDSLPPLKQRVELGEGAEDLLAVVDDQLRKIDERLVKILAWQRLQQVVAGEQCGGSLRGAALGEAAARRALRSLPHPPHPPHHPHHPHRPLPSELLSRADRERIASVVWGGALRGAPAPPRAPPAPPALPTAAARATLCPAGEGGIECAAQLIPMRLASLTIGSDSGCDVRLDAALCRRVSRNHAVIFLDEVSRHFELINYSEFGTQVNGVVYACDVSRGPSPPPAPPADHEAEGRAHALRDIIRHRMPKPHRINGDLTAPLRGGGCKCVGAGAGTGAWEGGALVPHGALLQFGCRAYVFSITDEHDEP